MKKENYVTTGRVDELICDCMNEIAVQETKGAMRTLNKAKARGVNEVTWDSMGEITDEDY